MTMLSDRTKSGMGRFALYLAAAATLFFLLAPTLIVIPLSFGSEKYLQFPPASWSLKWYEAFFRDADWMAALGFSLRIALITTVATMVLGILTSLALIRGEFRLKGLVKALVLAPMIVPHIVIAVSLYLSYSRWGLTGTSLGFVLAHTALCLPFVVLTVSAALQKMDASLEIAAMSCGATPLRAFRHITLPLAMPGMITGGIFAFITSLDEAVVSYFLSGLSGKSLTRKMFEDIDFDVSPIIPAVSTLILISSVLLMAAAEVLRRRRGNGG